MSDRLTRISLAGQHDWPGLLEWGVKTAPEMIARARSYADHLARQAELIRAAADADFAVTVVRGARVQHHIMTLQKGKPK